jgi:hypothetical protein
VRRIRGWYMHGVAGVLGVSVTLALGLSFDDFWLRAALAGVGAAAGVEMRVWTRPTRALGYEQRYRERAPDVRLGPMVASSALGLALRGRF